MITQLGLIAPLYNKRTEDETIPGSFGINEKEENFQQPWSDYAKRYNGLKTAEEIISRSFNFIIHPLLMAKEKYQMTNSDLTISTPGFHVVYRLMALDLLRGAELQAQVCQASYRLKINNCSVFMFPSMPEKVLSYSYLYNGNAEPQLGIRYQQKDNFTPHESIGPATDSVSAKWILAQLSSEEQKYLETFLSAPIIENAHPDYQEMSHFLNSTHSHVALIKTASNLIIDLAEAFKRQFEQSIIINQWCELRKQGIVSEEHEEVYVKQ